MARVRLADLNGPNGPKPSGRNGPKWAILVHFGLAHAKILTGIRPLRPKWSLGPSWAILVQYTFRQYRHSLIRRKFGKRGRLLSETHPPPPRKSAISKPPPPNLHRLVLSRSNGGDPQEEGTNLGVFVWLVSPRREATNLGVFDLRHLALLKRGCANLGGSLRRFHGAKTRKVRTTKR